MDEQETAAEQDAGTYRLAGYVQQRQPDTEDRLANETRTPARTPARWLRILQQVTEGAISHLTLQDLLRELLGRIREAMGVDNAAILLVNEAGTHLNLYAARGSEEDVTGIAQIPMGRGVAGAIASTGMPRIIDDLSQVEVENPHLSMTACSLIGAPLLLGDRVIGVIHIDSARPRHFTDEDSQLLQIIASRVALAIEHAQLYEAERAARERAEMLARQMQTLQAVSDVALEYAQLDDLLHALLPRIQEILGVDNVAILLPVADKSELTLYSVRGPEEAVMGNVHVPMGQGVAGTIAATRRPLIIENLATVPVSNPFLREHFRSLLGVPLLEGEQLVGVIHVDSIESRRFTDEELQLLQTLAERIGPAIAHSQQFERAQRKRLQAEERAAILQDTMERMDEFLSLASHELRTPLTSLAMNIQLIDYWINSGRPRRVNETEADYLQRAISMVRPFVQRSSYSIQRINRLIGDLLDAAYVREQRLALRPQRINLAMVVRESVEEQRRTHAPRTLIFEEAPDAIYVEGDADRIEQVLSNYISNALKYSDSSQSVRVTVSIEGDQAQVAVSDNGVGIPEAELEHIWERLYRVAGIEHQSGSRVGLGLGLYISRDIIERQGGQVGVRSTPGRGSTFWFSLPLAHVAPQD
ncbi:MAG TPA: GAF domain-containing sensor histidine kinase [Ktedonobacterales bacterium]|nr:GAF domain-containing sensor histidine kinase [Ktedonobacterales bacterium]